MNEFFSDSKFGRASPCGEFSRRKFSDSLGQSQGMRARGPLGLVWVTGVLWGPLVLFGLAELGVLNAGGGPDDDVAE
jgi:hypothetical protein